MTNQEPECNDWVYGGNVTTDVPVTGGSGLLCYTGSDSSHQASSISKTVLPTGRKFGRITQKGPNKKVRGRIHRF